MQLREVLRVLRRSWVIIVATLAVALAVGAVVTLVTPDKYETETMVLVSPAAQAAAAGSTAGPNSASAVQAAGLISDQVATYAALAETPAVLDPAIRASGVNVASADLVDDVTAEVIPQTSIITLTVDAATAKDAAALANAISASLIDQIQSGSAVGNPIQVTGRVVAAPEVPTSPASPLLLLNLAIAFAVGLVVAFLIIVVRRSLAAGSQDR